MADLGEYMYIEMVLSVMMNGPIMTMDTKDSAEERLALMKPLAAAIVEAAQGEANPMQAMAILVAVGQHESIFARYVLEGRCQDGPPGMRCDYDVKSKKSLSRGPFQVRKWCKGAWEAKDGSYESYVEGAKCAIHYVQKGFDRCIKSKYRAWPGAFSFYRGQPCSAGEQVGVNFKGQSYTNSMVNARKSFKEFEKNRSEELKAYIIQEYAAN